MIKPSQAENSTDHPIFLHHLGKYFIENSVILDIVNDLFPVPLPFYSICSSSPLPGTSIISPHLKELGKSQPVPWRNGCKAPLELQALHFEWVKVPGSRSELRLQIRIWIWVLATPPSAHFPASLNPGSFLLPTQRKGAWILESGFWIPKSGVWILLWELVSEVPYTASLDFLCLHSS